MQSNHQEKGRRTHRELNARHPCCFCRIDRPPFLSIKKKRTHPNCLRLHTCSCAAFEHVAYKHCDSVSSCACPSFASIQIAMSTGANTPESHGRHTSWVRATPGRQALHDELVYRWSTRQRKHAVWHGGALRALRQTISFQLHAKESTQVALHISYTRSMAFALAVAHIQ